MKKIRSISKNKLTIEQMQDTTAGGFCKSLLYIDGALLTYGWAASVFALTPIGGGTAAAVFAANVYCAYRYQ